MARSSQEAQQELERLQTMLRSVPDQRDEAAVKLSRRIRVIEKELSGDGGGGKESDRGSNPVLMTCLALIIGGLAFGIVYYAIRIGGL